MSCGCYHLPSGGLAVCSSSWEWKGRSRMLSRITPFPAGGFISLSPRNRKQQSPSASSSAPPSSVCCLSFVLLPTLQSLSESWVQDALEDNGALGIHPPLPRPSAMQVVAAHEVVGEAAVACKPRLAAGVAMRWSAGVACPPAPVEPRDRGTPWASWALRGT